jgi:hypothetical protein
MTGVYHPNTCVYHDDDKHRSVESIAWQMKRGSYHQGAMVHAQTLSLCPIFGTRRPLCVR